MCGCVGVSSEPSLLSLTFGTPCSTSPTPPDMCALSRVERFLLPCGICLRMCEMQSPMSGRFPTRDDRFKARFPRLDSQGMLVGSSCPHSLISLYFQNQLFEGPRPAKHVLTFVLSTVPATISICPRFRKHPRGQRDNMKLSMPICAFDAQYSPSDV